MFKFYTGIDEGKFCLFELFFALAGSSVGEKDCAGGHEVGPENLMVDSCILFTMNTVTWGVSVLALLGVTAVGYAMLSGGGQRVVTKADGTKVTMVGPYEVTGKSPVRKDKVVKSDSDWKKQLKPEQYDILRSKGTEPMFCEVGQLSEKAGAYHCVGCDLPLFKSGAKFDSGSGWPAFFEPYSKDNIWMKMDTTFGMVRVEVLCSRCDGHLGHVFEDGPADKTGLRFCINSKIIKFVKS